MYEIKQECTFHVLIKYSMGMKDTKKKANKNNCIPLLIPLRTGLDTTALKIILYPPPPKM
jgi:hypothetical protein